MTDLGPAGLYFFGFHPSPPLVVWRPSYFAVPTRAQAPIVDGADHISLVIAVVVLVIAIAGVSLIRRVATVEPAQPLSSTEARRLSERQQLNKYFLQNWRDRPTRPNLD